MPSPFQVVAGSASPGREEIHIETISSQLSDTNSNNANWSLCSHKHTPTMQVECHDYFYKQFIPTMFLHVKLAVFSVEIIQQHPSYIYIRIS